MDASQSQDQAWVLWQLSPGTSLGFQTPTVGNDSGDIEITLHSRPALDPHEAAETESRFPADDMLTTIRVHWDRTVTFQPPQWTTDCGELTRQSVVKYTLFHDIPPGLYAYPGDLQSPLAQAPVVTEAIAARSALELRRQTVFAFTPVPG